MEEPKNSKEEIEDTEDQWIETHADMVEWMTEPTKFPPRSDCG